MATIDWVELFPSYQVEHLSHSFSNHFPILLNTLGGRQNDQYYNATMFRFEAKWCLESSFEEMVKSWWKDATRSIPSRLESMGLYMLIWSKARSREVKRNRVDLKDRLSYLHNQAILDAILAEITEVQLRLNLEAGKEELFWEQRARVNWLKNGDRNTSYFHKIAVQQQFRRRISTLEDESRGRTTLTEEIIRLSRVILESFFSF